MFPFRIIILSALVCGMCPIVGRCQVVYPAKLEKYDVQLRYRIRAARDIRIIQFDALAKHLKAIGFLHADEKSFEQTLLDPGAETAVGTLPSSAVAKLFAEENIKTAILVPSGSNLLDDPKKAVQVRIGLASGLSATEQKMLHDQAVEQLARLGFVHSLGYDHLGYTLVRGTIPAGQVRLLAKDLRTLPAGWLVGGSDRSELPLPLRTVIAIRTVEVVPDLPTVNQPAVQSIEGKLSPEVKAISADPAAAEKPLVIEVILEQETGLITTELRTQLRSALPGVMVEGFIGNTVTLRLPRAAMLASVADLQDVRTVRLPRVASETTGEKGGSASTIFVVNSRVDQLHKLGYTGDGVTVVIIASEFPGIESKLTDGGKTTRLSIGSATLPPGSRVFDLTGEVNPTLMPRPVGASIGGTATALAVHQAAPQSALILLRIDPSRFHQLLTTARAISGESAVSPALTTRSEELTVRGEVLVSRRKAASEELTRAFSDLGDDPKTKKRRDDAAAAMKRLQQDESEHKRQLDRFLDLKNGLEFLRFAGVVVNTLVWESGYPHDAQSEVSRYLESVFASGGRSSAIRGSKKPITPVWIQAAGTSVGSVWSGPYLDADKNGVMEFAGADRKLAASRWTRELAFLGLRSSDGKAGNLTAGLKVRFTIQWREPHVRDVVLAEEPTFAMNLRLFQQIDPAGKTIPSDELVEVARTSGNTTRLYKSLGSGVYETTLNVTLPSDGAYAIRVDGGAVNSDLPQSARLAAELRPRLFVELLDPKQAANGIPVFVDDAVQNSGVGIPADSPAAVTIGMGEGSLTGVGPGVSLGQKPDLLAPGVISLGGKEVSGSGVSAGYAAGVAASVLSAGVRPSDMARAVGLKPGVPLVLPSEWIQSLTPKAARTGFNR